ncbi:hypothetical protein ACBY01_05015 [Sphingomonas sp. ac-8]|uniref:hypothetical protein n=1 Tax=Sphingomonas sp. ac-8 TaxID=3242977 RepID=UPI003A808D31
MIADILDTVLSLTALMDEESDKLVAPGLHRDLAECSAAKVRLVSELEAQMARRNRENPGWLQELEPDARHQFAAAIAGLLDASATNAEVLSRQIELSTELITAVASEVQRLTGTGSATYGAHGGLFQQAQATPISLNTRL